MFVGELALDGTLRPVRGVLPIAAWARGRGVRRLVVPPDNAGEAAVVGGHDVQRAAEPGRSWWRSCAASREPRPSPPPTPTAPARRGRRAAATLDLADVRGQEVPRRALEIAAAGGHNLLFVGPPGSGKTMLAQRLPGILPPLGFDEALETTMVYSIAGLLGGSALIGARPFRAPAPHGVGGGPGRRRGPTVRPGEISLAHNGVLFLDELLEFPRSVLETLRQPLEDRAVTIVRVAPRRHLPGRLHAGRGAQSLPVRPPRQRGPHLHLLAAAVIAAYRSRLSGPLLDRIDLHVDVPALPYQRARPRRPGRAERRDARARRARRASASRRAAAAPQRPPVVGRAADGSRRSTAPGTRCSNGRSRGSGCRPAPSPGSGASRARSRTWPAAPPSAPRTSPRPSSTASSINHDLHP